MKSVFFHMISENGLVVDVVTRFDYDLTTAGLACYVVTLVAIMSHTLVDRNLMSFDTALVPCLKATMITMENFYWEYEAGI